MSLDGVTAFKREIRATLLQCGVEATLELVSMLAPEQPAEKIVEEQVKQLALALVVNEGQAEARRKLLEMVRLDPVEVDHLMPIAVRSAVAHREREKREGRTIRLVVSA